jgi:ribosomal protein S18 acetylase RimI-like enzyme
MNAWPAIKTVYNNGCVIRLSEGYTKRSNSVNALYHNGKLDEIIKYAEDLYSRNRLPTIFKMLEHPKYAVLDRMLDSYKYEKLEPTTVMTLSLSSNDYSESDDVLVQDHFTDAWIGGFIACNRLEARAETIKTLLSYSTPDKVVASVTVDNRQIGFGFGALEAGYIGFFDIFIHQDFRGLGFGRKVMEALLRAAKDKGQEFGYLQVRDTNYPALRLYEKLGFRPAYGYWYRKLNCAKGA